MVTPPLTPRDVATARGWEIGSVYRYLTESRRRHRMGQELNPGNIPLPDASTDPPRWSPDGPIREWIARTQPTERTESTATKEQA